MTGETFLEEVRYIMDLIEYKIACADEPVEEQVKALRKVADWCTDMQVFIHTGIAMADSDVFAS